jgi:hypothetical protein
MYQPLPLQDPAKFTQIAIFGLKIYHLAALVVTLHVFYIPLNPGALSILPR